MLRRTSARRCSTTLVSGVVLALAWLGTAAALHRHTPAVLQVTNAASTELGGISYINTSNLLLFHSDADLLGNGNAAANVFLFAQTDRVKRGLFGVYQLTFEAPSRAPTGAKRGKLLAFESTADQLDNGSTGREVFASRAVRYKDGVAPLFQVTNSAAGESYAPQLNAHNGKYLVFASTADLLSLGLDAQPRIYRAAFASVGTAACASYPCPGNPGLEIVTTAPAGSFAFDSSGRFLVFDSAGDVLGPGTSNGFRQLYLKDFTTGVITRLTNGAGDSRNPIVSRKAAQIVFESDAPLLGPSAHTQVFRINRQKNPAELTQLTFGADGDSVRPSMDAKGHLVVLSSDAALLPGDSAGTFQVYLVNLKQGTTARLTSGGDDKVGAHVQFQFPVFPSASDLAGNGNSALQLFLLNVSPVLEN